MDSYLQQAYLGLRGGRIGAQIYIHTHTCRAVFADSTVRIMLFQNPNVTQRSSLESRRVPSVPGSALIGQTNASSQTANPIRYDPPSFRKNMEQRAACSSITEQTRIEEAVCRQPHSSTKKQKKKRTNLNELIAAAPLLFHEQASTGVKPQTQTFICP